MNQVGGPNLKYTFSTSIMFSVELSLIVMFWETKGN